MPEIQNSDAPKVHAEVYQDNVKSRLFTAYLFRSIMPDLRHVGGIIQLSVLQTLRLDCHLKIPLRSA